MEPKLRITIEPTAYLVAAMVLLCVPIPWVISWVIAALVHEAGHGLAVWIFGYRLQHIHVGSGGVALQTGPMASWKAALCSMAGPAAGFLLMYVCRKFALLAVCAFVQSVYNLLPLCGLDGERFLHSIVMIFGKNDLADRVCHMAGTLTMLCVVCLCAYSVLILKLGILPLMVVGLLFLRKRNRKTPCKAGRIRVQ